MDISLHNQTSQNISTQVTIKPPESKEREDQEKKSVTTSDKVIISKEGQALSEEESNSENVKEEGLSAEDTKTLLKMKSRDSEVRAHEQAHLAAAGGFAQGGASYTMETGPDGQPYAVAGEVGIDLSKGKTPAETVAKMRQIQQAALAPAQPSSTDRQVAAQASAIEQQAQQEVLESRSIDTKNTYEGSVSISTGEPEETNKTEQDDSTKNASSGNNEHASIYLSHFRQDALGSDSNSIAIA
ncbi:MAG: putative metalloprotease CJM1_0395 family protein [Desulfotalea sp.]